jgi:hypothetical protein
LMEYGIRQNPENWRLYYDLGFVYYTELKDYKKAGDAFERGSQVPGSFTFLKVLAARMHENAGDYSTARLLWTATYESTKAPDIRQNALEHLRCLRVEEDVTNLQTAVTRFGERSGHLPTSIWELVSSEHLPGVPVDPDGHPYEMDLEGRILVHNPDDFPFITKGVPPGYKPTSKPTFHVKE